MQVEHGGGWVINIVSAEAVAPYPSAPVRRRTRSISEFLLEAMLLYFFTCFQCYIMLSGLTLCRSCPIYAHLIRGMCTMWACLW